MFQVVIIISTSFQGAFLFVGGVDYYLENSKVLYYSVNILHGKVDRFVVVDTYHGIGGYKQ